jgi:hypothetical protein
MSNCDGESGVFELMIIRRTENSFWFQQINRVCIYKPFLRFLIIGESLNGMFKQVICGLTRLKNFSLWRAETLAAGSSFQNAVVHQHTIVGRFLATRSSRF